MHPETSLVALLKDIPEHNLHRGDVGTVAFLYDIVPDQVNLYEVEFMNAAGDTLAIVTLSENDIKAVELQNVILHLSERAA